MERTSEVILRNKVQLLAGPTLLINPPRDYLFRDLQSEAGSLRAVSQDFGDWRWLTNAGALIDFETVPAVDKALSNIVLFLPREKERLNMLLHACAANMSTDARLWLVGENRAGIKSSPRQLKAWFRQVEKRDSARHCGLFSAGEPLAVAPFKLEDYERHWSAPYADQQIELRSLPGVFAHGRLDKGTALLLGVMAELKPSGKVLDFACGSGVIGLSLLACFQDVDLTLLDSSSLALESSRRSLLANRQTATVLPSDGLSELSSQFDWVISNPPFHHGVANDLGVAEKFFRQVGTFLAYKGRIVIVFNRHLPYSRWMQNQFERVEHLGSSKEYSIVQAFGPNPNR